jgi:hypothetical protein
MRITPADIDNAVLQIFLERKLGAGGVLPLADLRGAWARTRLRRSDLIEGIKRLIYAGALRVQRDDAQARLELTAAGAARAGTLPAVPRGSWARHLMETFFGRAVDDDRDEADLREAPERRRTP